MDKLMNKMDDMEMDKVAGGSIKLRPRLPRSGCHDSNANSMAANVDIDKTQNASGWLVP
jgi:hypothetical protein